MTGVWPSNRLGDVCTVIAGQSPKATFYNEDGKGLPFYQGKKEFSERLIGQPTKWTTFVTKEAEAGDILMSVRAPVGPINQATEKICIGRGLAAIRPHAVLCRDYVWYALSWLQPTIRGNAGAVFESINKAGIECLRIPVPPLEEQRRIVAVLDEAFEGLDCARTHTRSNLQNTQDFLALMVEHELAVSESSWAQTTIAEVCSRFEYGTSSKSKPSGQMPVLRMGNLQGGEIDWSDLVYSNSADDITKYELRPSDVLFNRTNSLEHVRKAAIYRGENSAIFAGYLIRLQCKNDIIQPEFLNFYLNSKRARDYGRAISGKSINQANISASKLKTYPVPLPPLRRQAEIIERIRNMHAPICELETSYSNRIRDIDDLRQSLLHRAFAGKLT